MADFYSRRNDAFESFFIENGIYTVPVTIIKYKNATHTFQGVKTKDAINEIINEMKKLNKKKGCASLCIGGGMGIALCVERN